MDTKLDPKVLNSIRDLTEENEQDFLTTLIKGFYERFEECFPKMKDCAQAGNLKELLEASHKFKGSATNISAIAVGEVCQTIEDHCHNSDSVDYDKLLVQLEKIFQATKNQLDNDWVIS